MAQHIPILNSNNKSLARIVRQIISNFSKGIEQIKGSLKFQQIYDERYCESKNDLVFVTWRVFDKEKQTFEVHFDKILLKITQIYLVA